MSIVYRYYIGYVEDGKAYPLGPYDDFGTFCPVVRRSGSSASRLHEKFRTLPEDMAGAQLLSMFGHEDVFGNMAHTCGTSRLLTCPTAIT